MHWSGCPAGCANHATADIGLQGKNIKRNGEIVEAVDVFAGGAAGCEPNPPIKLMEDVPCDELPGVIAGLVKHGAFKAMRQQLRKLVEVTPPATETSPASDPSPAQAVLTSSDIAEGGAKMIRAGNEEIAVFKKDGRLCAIQNICPHEGGQLAQGWIDGDAVVCPLHGYKFNLQTGACLEHARLRAKVFDLIEVGDHCKINLSSKGRRK